MPRPNRYFVRIWTVDPKGEGPDDETNIDVPSKVEALALAKHERLKRSRNAGAFERVNIHVPDDIPIADPPSQFWEWEDVQLDEAEIDREWRIATGRKVRKRKTDG